MTNGDNRTPFFMTICAASGSGGMEIKMSSKDKNENLNEKTKEKNKNDDILTIAHQFISYFEELDRGEKSDTSIKSC